MLNYPQCRIRRNMSYGLLKSKEHIERFRDANSGYSGYKSAHAYKCTRVVQSRTFRVINKMATSYDY